MPEGMDYRQFTGNKLFIWDNEGTPPDGDHTLVLWRGYDTGRNTDGISIPQMIEANAEKLRSQYLAWVYELGEMRIYGKRMVDQLEMRLGFSYWWMTLIAEKCYFSKSSNIDDAVRLMAFDDWVMQRPAGQLILVSANSLLAECLRLWCANSGYSFDWQQVARPSQPRSWARRLYDSTPYILQALALLVRVVTDRWPLRGLGLKEWKRSEGRTVFITYSDNMAPSAANLGRYESRYWAHLPDALKRRGEKINWLHLYIKDSLLPTAKIAAEKLRAFNENGQGDEHHVTIDTFLSIGVAFHALFDWLLMCLKGHRLRKQFAFQQANMYLQPLLEDDWRQSFFGVVAMRNALNLNLFEAAFKCLPQQHSGVYLQENQGWEFGLIQAWKAGGHGRLIGTPHSTVRFWDLRYFFDPRIYRSKGQNDIPLPDHVACNGVAAKEAYINGGYPADHLIDVEALRFLHLHEPVPGTGVPSNVNDLRVLVMGDYLDGYTKMQMGLLEKAARWLPAGTSFIVKPHPNCPINQDDHPGIDIKLTTEPLEKLLGECDVAYASATTSAVVDAYCSGVPVLSVLDPNILNLSPLRGCKGVFFVSSPEELAAALIAGAATSRNKNTQNNYFTIDPLLPRWLLLLTDRKIS
jgi:surface carbohydrate biosynthesis protein (TIGR04326 family)